MFIPTKQNEAIIFLSVQLAQTHFDTGPESKRMVAFSNSFHAKSSMSIQGCNTRSAFSTAAYAVSCGAETLCLSNWCQRTCKSQATEVFGEAGGRSFEMKNHMRIILIKPRIQHTLCFFHCCVRSFVWSWDILPSNWCHYPHSPLVLCC